MSFAKRLLLGSAAAMAVVGSAQAADLPLAEPVEYVKVCNTYGEGFFYIPGSETCLRINGYVRAEYRFANFDDNDDERAYTQFFARGQVQFDARTESEYGTIRSFIGLRFQRTGDGGVGGSASSGGPLIHKAFVQFGGLTAGRVTSFFDYYASANLIGSVAGSDIETQALAYTATFGTGFSATIALEDQTERRFAFGDYSGGGNSVSAYAGQRFPDVVANLRAEQGWGSAQLSGALRDINPRKFDRFAPVFSNGEDELGFAVQAGVTFNLPFLAEGDTLILQAAYADGALSYLNPGLGYNGFFAGATNASDFTAIGGDTDTSTGFVVLGELLHYWTPSLRSVAAVSYSDIEAARGGNDFQEWVAAGSLIWSPVKKLDIGLEIGYTNIDNDYDRRTTSSRLDDIDDFSGVIRIERSF